MHIKTILAALAAMTATVVAAPVNANATEANIARRGGGEIGYSLCRHQYVVTHEEWRIQVPEAWWKDRFRGDAGAACKAWKRALQSERMCGLRFNDCFELAPGGGSGDKGWLFAKATTCIGPNTPFFENSFQVFDIHKGEKYEIACHHGIHL